MQLLVNKFNICVNCASPLRTKTTQDGIRCQPVGLLAIGYWLLAIGYWLLAIGYWLLAIADGKLPTTQWPIIQFLHHAGL
ncbi:hypothetical protein NUK49_13185 [Aeromonas caviae]|uniref:hypothetical protein n=1 Tax=Aeromonas caviae TaxID=648 RepID=UPI00214EF1C4|nr:hypothetical protein [Aeromonas caviae]MCR3984538.1 hypothetical protein [Aeromonas caviae]